MVNFKLIKCTGCSKFFKRAKNQIRPGRHFCSIFCSANYFSSKSKHIVMKQKEIRKNVFKKFNNQCVKCGIKKNLCVHHIDKSGDMANWEYSNNNLDNLMLLCSSCHGKIHGGTNIKKFVPFSVS